MRRLGSIQRLRAAAALSVLVFHAGQWSGRPVATAAAGVDIFFVISGFVLWTAAQARPVGPAAFLSARLLRVAPLYWLATLAVAALVLWRPQAMPTAQFAPGHLGLSLLLIPHNDPAGDAFPLLASGWTLTYEAFFYLALAAALAGPRARSLHILCGIVTLGALAGLAYPALYPLLANPLLLEFLLGVGLARLWARGTLGRGGGWRGWTALALGVGALVMLQALGVDSDLLRPFLWSMPATLIVAGALMLEAGGGLNTGPLGRALEALGDASYSIYLCQLPVISVFAWLARDAGPPAHRPLAFALSAVVLAVVSGLVCHRLIERPLGVALKRIGSALGRRQRAALDRLGRGLRPPEQEALAAVDADLA